MSIFTLYHCPLLEFCAIISHIHMSEARLRILRSLASLMAYERNSNMNRKKGFTLAELLIVVAIISVLVAVSVPIFTSQRRKAVDAVNKANIRAAKAMALTAFYDDKTEYVDSSNHTKMAYFKYTNGSLDPIKGNSHDINALATKTVCAQAARHERCDCIYVYVSLNDAKPIQTAPYLDQNGNIQGNGSRQFG